MGKKTKKPKKYADAKQNHARTDSKEILGPSRHIYPTAERPIKLTISLLVSNRIATVRKCLKSIKPLLDSVPSELIVVDTVGPENSDGSLAVAREYTDKIIHFDWCDDFAAARNAGLKLAKGEWFLYLDDDEWFEDATAIIDFLKTDDYKYNICKYKVRNYVDRNGQKYSDVYTSRLVRRSGEVFFEGRIHETLVGTMPPVKSLDTYVHHYGYVFENKVDYEKHFSRNTQPLEKMLKEQPGNLRTVVHLVQEYLAHHEYDKAGKLCREALDGHVFEHTNVYCSVLSYQYVRGLILEKRWKELLYQSNRLLERPDVSELAKCNICFLRNEFSFAIFDSHETLKNIDEYCRYVDILDADPDKLSDQQELSLGECQSEYKRALVINCGLTRANELGDVEHSWSYIKRIAENPGEHHMIIMKCMAPMVQYAAETDSFDRLYFMIEPHLKVDSILTCFLSSTQAYMELFKEHERPNQIADFLAKLPIDKPYIVLLKMRAAEKERNFEDLAKLFSCYFALTDGSHVHEIVQIAYRNRVDLSKYEVRICIDQWNIGMRLLVDICSLEQARNILQYIEAYFQKDSLEILSLKAAIELKSLKANRTQDNEMLFAGFSRYIELLYAYHISLINSDNFTEERCHYLDADARAVFYLEKAIDLEKKGDISSQLRLLKIALSLKGDLVDFISIIMKNLEKQIEHQKSTMKAQANMEFQTLAARLKGVIAEYILREDYQNAKIVLDQLKQILPNDPDIHKFQIQLMQLNE